MQAQRQQSAGEKAVNLKCSREGALEDGPPHSPGGTLRIWDPILPAMRSHWVLSKKVLGSSAHLRKITPVAVWSLEQERRPRAQLESSHRVS